MDRGVPGGPGAIDSLAPRRSLEAIGLVPTSRRRRATADGRDVTVGELEIMGELSGGVIVFGDEGTEPLLGVTALESAGIEVDPQSQQLKRLPAVRLRGLRRDRGATRPRRDAAATPIGESPAMRPSVYVETIIPSFYFEGRLEPEMAARRHWTRDWWDNHRPSYALLTSDAVVDELERGDFPNKNEALALIQDLPLLEVSPAVADTVSTHISHRVMPADPAGDALHLAVASVHKCDFLLT